jgi:glycosyltransferase involved in cell wall biosynthesis
MLSAHKPRSSTKPLFGVSRKYFLFTAIARLTVFKNADLLIDGAKILLFRGMDVSVLVAGGDGSKPHSDIRARLVERVPSHLRDCVQVVEKIPQEELYTYFNSDRVRETGIFVCSSRYETLGITPLEAALSGVTTVITDSKQVETTRYFPADYRFEASAEELANPLEGLYRRNLLTCGQDLKSYVEETIEERGSFENEFLKVWRDMSSLSLSSYHHLVIINQNN